jgi:hypothetical protein
MAGGYHAAESECGELAGGEHPVLPDRAHELAVSADQMRGAIAMVMWAKASQSVP